MSLLATNVADADSVFAEVDKSQILPAHLLLGEFDCLAEQVVVVN